MTSSNATFPPALTRRDYLMLKTIAEYGALTAQQVSMLFFPPATTHSKVIPHSNCQYHLKRMRDLNYVQRVERYQLLTEGKKPYLYAVTRKGIQALAAFLDCEVQDISWRHTDVRLTAPYVEHLILMNDVRVAIAKAVQDKPSLQLLTWHDELTLKQTHHRDTIPVKTPQGKTHTGKLIPDAYFVLSTQSHQENKHFFVEIDRATETGTSSDERQRTWMRKITMYLVYYQRNGLYEQRYGTHKGRVLTVTTNEARLHNLKRLTEEAGGKQRFWFTTFERLNAQTVLTGSIWQMAHAQGTTSLLDTTE